MAVQSEFSPNRLIEKDQWGFDGGRVKERRKQLHITQKQLAVQLGSTQSTICNYETGKATPSLKAIIQLAVVLNTSVDYFLRLSDNPQPTVIGNAVSEIEQDLWQAYCSLPLEKRERAIGILIGLREG